MTMTADTFRHRLAIAITRADADGFPHFAEALRETLRRELAPSLVVLDNNDTARTRCELGEQRRLLP